MRKAALLLTVLTSSFCLLAQKPKPPKPDPGPLTGDSDSALFSKLKYRLVGPWRGGRSGAVTGSYKNKNTFYFGSTGGGVWKTTDGGSNWKNISDKYFGGSIGAVAVAPSDERILYVGEGENTMRGNVSEGLRGMWRSDDGGRSWKNIGLGDARHIIRIVIHPQDPNTVWVAAMGHLFGASTDRGVFKTTDGGRNWKKVLYVNDQAGASDLVMEPGNANVLYAGTWRVIRTPYSLESGGEGSGLWKSTDGGERWTNISSNKGLPAGTWGIVGVAVTATNPDKVYALIENSSGGMFVSNDGGESWTLTSNDNNIRQRAWYYTKVFVDPSNENLVYAPNVQLMRSRDGGKSFQSISTPHGDHHDLWIDPADGNRMIVADDGGAQISFDGGENWSTYMNQPTAQFYRVSTDNAFPYRILGAQQDNTTIRIRSRSYGGSISERDWQETAGSESGYVVADPLNPDIVYGGNYGGYLSRLDHRTGENRAISVWPDNPIGAGADLLKYRFQWNFPIFFSPHNPRKLYAAGNHLFVTENEGQSWKTISPDLTTNDKSKQLSSGGPITKDNTSVEYYCTIFTAAESVLEKDLLWTGSDDGLVYLSRNGGGSWENVTPANAPKWMMWNAIETDPFKRGKAFIVGSRYKLDDYTPYIYKTEDYGKSWTLVTKGINPMHFARVIRADLKRPGLLYAGTEYGMYISYDDGTSWKKFQLNLPEVAITDLTIKENDLIVATQGRSFWVLDDLSLVQQKDEAVIGRALHVFNPAPAYRMDGFVINNPRNAGMNPPNGVVFNYFLRNAKDTAKFSITIYDSNGKLVRTFSNDQKDVSDRVQSSPGMNQFVWNMQYPSAERIEGMILWSGHIGSPKVSPGTYRAVFRTATDSVEVPFTIMGDPNYHMTQADYDEQVSFLLKVKDKFSEIQQTIKSIRRLRSQLNDLAGRTKDADVKKLSDSISNEITSVEEALYQTKAKSSQDVLNYPIRLNDKISGLYDFAASGYNPPAQQVKEAFAELSSQADVQLAKYKRVALVLVPQLNKLIHEKMIPVIGVKE
ncbi:MAG TPA: hypothetical protein VF145_11280 [Chitinophagaceae bacterium]